MILVNLPIAQEWGYIAAGWLLCGAVGVWWNHRYAMRVERALSFRYPGSGPVVARDVARARAWLYVWAAVAGPFGLLGTATYALLPPVGVSVTDAQWRAAR